MLDNHFEQAQGERQIVPLHHGEREKQGIAKQNTCDGERWNQHLHEPSHFSRALEHGPCHEVSNQDCAIKENVVQPVGDHAPRNATDDGCSDSESDSVNVVRLQSFVVRRGLVHFLSNRFLASGADVCRQAVPQRQIGCRGRLALFAAAVESGRQRFQRVAQFVRAFHHFLRLWLREAVDPLPSHEVLADRGKSSLLLGRERWISSQGGFDRFRLIPSLEAQKDDNLFLFVDSVEADHNHVTIARPDDASRFSPHGP